MKKLLSLSLILALAVTALASCGGDSEDSKAEGTKAPTTAEQTEADTDKVTDADTDATTDAATDAATDAVTDAQKPAGNEAELFKFDFTKEEDCDFWALGATGTAEDLGFDEEEKCLDVKIVKEDAQIQCDSFGEEIDVEDITSFTFEVKNATNDTKGQIFFFLDGGIAPSEPCSVRYTYQNSGENAEWETITVTITDDNMPSPWTGFLTGFRFDITDKGTEGHVSLRNFTINGIK